MTSEELSSKKVAKDVKRAFDFFSALLAVLGLFVPFLILAMFIKWQSPGPIFFRQTRVGLHGKDFQILKFRSMHISGAAISNASTTRHNDSRIFKGGMTIRKYKLDELPQILNILKGDMSLVGPRPTVRDDHDRMTSQQQKRVTMRPGLTGLAQISGNTMLSWPQRIELDLEYIRNFSVLNDVLIIFKTIGQVITGKADTHPATDDEWS